MDTKFTPGPWEATFGRRHWNIKANEKMFVVADTVHGSAELQRANGKLIGAAPDLYEALSALVVLVDKVKNNDGWRDDGQLEAARAALAKVQP